jgi:hypothetical protein
MALDPRSSKVKAVHTAQDILMNGIAKTLGYWAENGDDLIPGWYNWTAEEKAVFQEIVKAQADRVAKVFGYDKAWIA